MQEQSLKANQTLENIRKEQNEWTLDILSYASNLYFLQFKL